MTLESEFVSALIDNVAARTQPDRCFSSVLEAQALALHSLKSSVMESILQNMQKSRMSGYMPLDFVDDNECFQWLLGMGFHVYKSETKAFVTWGKFPKLSDWKAVRRAKAERDLGP